MIQLGPKGLSQGLKRILNLLVEEISLVDKAAIRREFLLIKRDLPEALDSQRGLSSMDLKDMSKLEDGEVMVFEKEEELALPPDVVRTLKLMIGQLSKLIGYKYKAKYQYTKPGSEKKEPAETEQAKKPEEEEEPEKEKKKKEEEEEKKRKQEKIQEQVITTPGPREIENAEVSKEVADSLTELSKLVDNDSELDTDAVQAKIGEIKEKLAEGSGGEDK